MVWISFIWCEILLNAILSGAIGGGAVFQEDMLPTVLTSVECNGTEENILSCRSEQNDDCRATDNAAHVVCQG